jgi:hypothetical protein
VCLPCEAALSDCYCRLHHEHHVRPIVEGRIAARLLPSSSTVTAPPGSCCVVLRPSSCHVLLKAHVRCKLCFKCFGCFRDMLQMFQIDVAKVDYDVAMVVHICCKGLLPMFHLCFLDVYSKCVYLDVAYVLHIHHMCFICITAYDCNVFKFFSSVSEA